MCSSLFRKIEGELPGTNLDKRLINGWPRYDSLPINPIDWTAYYHDLRYNEAGDDLAKKHIADEKMITELDAIPTDDLSIKERLIRNLVKRIIKAKVRFGLGLGHNPNNCIDCLRNFGNGLSYEEAVKLHKEYRKPKLFRKMIHFKKDSIWHADLIIMPPERGFKYALTIIDGFTRFAWAVPLKTKTGAEVAAAFQKVFQESGRRSERLCVDEGKEFYNQHMYKLYSFSKDDIRKKEPGGDYINTMFSIYGESKNALIERFNRTLTNKLWFQFDLQGNQKWLHLLQPTVDKYNNTIHSELKVSPTDASKYPKRVRPSFTFTNEKPNFKVGDKVHIYRYKEHFEKGRKGYWKISELFTIKKVLHTNPITYIIEDEYGEEIIGSFYASQLQAA